MKTFFVTSLACFLTALVWGSASAATINLEGGDVITVNPNVSTTVRCSAAGSGSGSLDCASKADAFEVRLEACYSAAPTNPAWCVETLWPEFRRNNSSCIEEGSAVCTSTCVPRITWNPAWCVETCR